MKKFILVILTLAGTFTLQAQPAISAVGEYLLEGEMETAAGLKLDSNGQFQFFFSYGALDRQGKGVWRLEGERLVLRSEPREAKDFQLMQSKHIPNKYITILLSGAQPEILPFFSATGTLNQKQVSGKADRQGRIVLSMVKVDSLVLRFEWCPEKTFRYGVDSLSHNQFSFRLLPSITDVIFNDNAFTIDRDQIKGPLPFSGDHVCTFRRTSREDNEP